MDCWPYIFALFSNQYRRLFVYPSMVLPLLPLAKCKVMYKGITWRWPRTHSTFVMINLIISRCFTHGLLLCFILLYIFNGSVSTSLVGHVLYSADLMSATCIPHLLLMIHRYIYSRYSSVFLMLYQLYHSLPSSTLNSSSSLYLSVATWVIP